MAKCYASKVVDYALTQVGTKENPMGSNKNKYAEDIDKNYPDFYNTKKNGFSWCDVFVDDCFIHCYGEDNALRLLCQPRKSLGAGCKYSLMYYKDKGQYHTSNPKVGDQIFFGKTEKTAEHTGLVYKVSKTKVYTVEGNSGNMVKKKSYDITDKNILGYGRPKYDTEPKEEKPVAAPVKEDKPKETAKPKEDKPKSDNKVVKASSPAEKKDDKYKGEYVVTGTTALNMRDGAGKKNKILTVLSKGDVATCYGYYSIENGVKWLYVAYAKGKITYEGFCCSSYLKK